MTIHRYWRILNWNGWYLAISFDKRPKVAGEIYAHGSHIKNLYIGRLHFHIKTPICHKHK